ncbi:hypothetical protein BG015_010581 [Linnemannia schmuckeri]|uniref:Uncharacterized protein n=1 Tax=Linnemannia schmuckeri TaxID=64567 RepID=A0A9P5V8S6_9FUNG|nr:hypothetical protein BG015_010581 [Linnemannia schmuckeri]
MSGPKDDLSDVIWDAELAKFPIDLDATVKLASNMAASKAKSTFHIHHSNYSHKSQPPICLCSEKSNDMNKSYMDCSYQKTKYKS